MRNIIIYKVLNYPWWSVIVTKLFYNWRFKNCGKGVIVRKPLKITPNSISLGNTVSIMPNCRLEGVKSYYEQQFSPLIVIGNGVSFQQNLHMTCANSIKIGDNTAIAANVTITDINHSYLDINIPIEKQRLDVAEVIIGEDCKIYNNAVILPGAKIGKHCVIGAGSIVSGSFDDFCVIVGAPAKVVKKYDKNLEEWCRV